MNVLVTGGAGFIGSNLCKVLVLNGYNVICVDNFYTGSIENIKGLLDKQNFSFITEDIRNDLCEVVPEQLDWIFNLACPASPVHYQKNSIFTLETSVLGGRNVLELAKKKKCRILQASTSEIYGDPLEHPQTENYWGNVNPIGLRSCYDEGKRVVETLFYEYRRFYKIDARIVRIFNTYGPNMQVNDGRVVSNFIVQSLKGNPITIFGTGSQTRSFCYIDDLIRGLLCVMESKDYNGPYNIGNPNEYTVFELVETISWILKTKENIVFRDLPADDPKKRNPDISKMKNEFSWVPLINLENGLLKTIQYFRKLLKRS